MNEHRMVNFRLPAELKGQLEAAAEKDSRTISGLIVVILKTWLADNAAGKLCGPK